MIDKLYNFTKREKEIIHHYIGGFLSKEIAKMLGITSQTLQKHRKNIIGKSDNDTFNKTLLNILEGSTISNSVGREKILNDRYMKMIHLRYLKGKRVREKGKTLSDGEKMLQELLTQNINLGYKTFNVNNISQGKGLTASEMRIFYYISQGLTNQEISDNLFISKSTLITHRHNIITKLGSPDGEQLFLLAYIYFSGFPDIFKNAIEL